VAATARAAAASAAAARGAAERGLRRCSMHGETRELLQHLRGSAL